jgi:hypothetical protein
LDVGEDLLPQTKAEINNGRWPAPLSPQLNLTFLKNLQKNDFSPPPPPAKESTLTST